MTTGVNRAKFSDADPLIEEYVSAQVQRGIRRESAMYGLENIRAGKASPNQIQDPHCRALAWKIVERDEE